MKKRLWLIPILIVAINASAIIIRWNTLPYILPAHFDLQGNAGGSMPRNVLLLYPLISAVVCLIAYVFARRKQNWQMDILVLASAACLVVLSSTMVSLTAGKIPFFMLDEPLILLIAVSFSIVHTIRKRKKH